MRPFFESVDHQFDISMRRSRHFPPHLHNVVECIYIEKGEMELGIGRELFHMEQGDFAFIFPGLIHHAQYFGTPEGRFIDLFAAMTYFSGERDTLLSMQPEEPIIHKAGLHKDIPWALKALLYQQHHPGKPEIQESLVLAYLQIIAARSLEAYSLIERQHIDDEDLIFRCVRYVAEHFHESITLTEMAKALYVSPYALSRLFSSAFKTNFNGYVNETRLEYACAQLRHSDQPITEVYMNAGFDSQRTFNRVFQDRLHMTPREYRNKFRELQKESEEDAS